MSGLTQVGPNFVGLQNYIKLFEGGDIWIYAKKHDDFMDYVFCSANFFVFIIGSMVFGCAPETKRFQIFQDRDLSAKPDHGICIFNVIFHFVCRERTDQFFIDSNGIHHRTI